MELSHYMYRYAWKVIKPNNGGMSLMTRGWEQPNGLCTEGIPSRKPVTIRHEAP